MSGSLTRASLELVRATWRSKVNEYGRVWMPRTIALPWAAVAERRPRSEEEIHDVETSWRYQGPGSFPVGAEPGYATKPG